MTSFTMSPNTAPTEGDQPPSLTLLLATSDGIWSGGDPYSLEGRNVSELTAADDGTLWALVDGSELHPVDGPFGVPGSPTERGPQSPAVAVLGNGNASVIHVHASTVFVGGDRARLWRLEGDELQPVASFDEAPTHPDWYTPWGGPPSIMSMTSLGADLYVGVHVGGIIRSSDGGATWEPTIDLNVDVHQVVADPARGTLYAAVGMGGLAVSGDRGDSWRFHHRGLHARYLLAAAVTSAGVLVGASSGPRAKDGAVYLFDGDRFDRVEGLADHLDGAVGPRRIVGRGDRAALVAPDGTVYVSGDGGRRWSPSAAAHPTPSGLLVVP